MTPEAIRGLSVSALKAILFRNHVSAGMVVEKAELVAKVERLVEDERIECEAAARRQQEEDQEEEQLREILERSRRDHEETEARRRAEEQEHQDHSNDSRQRTPPDSSQNEQTTPPDHSVDSQTPPPPPQMTPKAQAMASHLERTGLCVICQDEEANIAIVDCG